MSTNRPRSSLALLTSAVWLSSALCPPPLFAAVHPLTSRRLPTVSGCFLDDGDGGRVTQTTAGGTTTFLGQSYELAPDGTTTKYVFAGSQRIAAQDSTGALRYYHGDHLGSSNVITDGIGALVELAEYRPYGTLSHREGTVEVPQKFTGQEIKTGAVLNSVD